MVLVFVVAMGLWSQGAYAATDNPRHSVVYIEAGMIWDGQWSGLPKLNDKGKVVYREDGKPETVWYTGTAFFVDDGEEHPQYLITNDHVISEFESFGSGKTYELSDGTVIKSGLRIYYDGNDFEEAYLVGSDTVKDIALLRIDRPTEKRDGLSIGEAVDGASIRCIGFPSLAENQYAGSTTSRGEQDATVTSGTITRMFTQSGSGVRTIQTDAIIMSGNSGGPMVDESGNVVGISTYSVESSDSSINYAIDISMATTLLDQNDVTYTQAGSSGSSSSSSSSSSSDTTTASVKLVWDDSDDEDGLRPAAVTATLSTGDEVTLESSNGWSQKVKDLPKEEDGEEVAYTWTIADIDGYELSESTSSSSTTVTATHTVAESFNVLPIVAVVACVAIAGVALFVMRKKLSNKKKGKLQGGSPARVRPDDLTRVSRDGSHGTGDGTSHGRKPTDHERAGAGPAVAQPQQQNQPDDSGLRLLCISGSLAGKRYMIPTNGKVVVGRAADCGVIIPTGTAGVSAHHCEVWVEGHKAYVSDLGSTYGTFVEPGTRLTSGQTYGLQINQRFWLGDRAESYQIVEKRG